MTFVVLSDLKLRARARGSPQIPEADGLINVRGK